MFESNDKDQGKKKVTEINTFSVPFTLGEIKKDITVNTTSNASKEQIINQALNFHSQGNILEAVKFYQYLINKGLNDHRVLSNYGVILSNNGKLKEGELLLRKAIELKPEFADAHNNLGTILKYLGNLKDAELSTRKAIKLNPDYANAHSNLGNILKDLGKLQDAEKSYLKAIELNPLEADFYFQKGVILKLIGRYEDAIQSFNQASELDPKNSKYYGFRGLKISNFYRESLTKNNNLIQSINQSDWQASKILLDKKCKDSPKYTKENVNEFIKLWCDHIKILVEQDSPKKFVPILVNIIFIDERNKNINNLIKYVFESFDLNLLLDFADQKDRILLILGYSQYKFIIKDFSEAEFIASNNIKEAEILIKRKETEDLGWLITRRSLALFSKKNIARDSLTNLINNLHH